LTNLNLIHIVSPFYIVWSVFIKFFRSCLLTPLLLTKCVA
jgi:hypothetical protein